MRQHIAALIFAILCIAGCQRDKPAVSATELKATVALDESAAKRRSAGTHFVTTTNASSAKASGHVGSSTGNRNSTATTSATLLRVVSGRVTDMAGNPVANAAVETVTEPYTSIAAQTNANGEFKMENFPNTPVGVRASATGYLSNTKSTIAPDRTTVNFVLQALHQVSFRGEVLDDKTSQPVAGAFINCVEPITSQTTTDNRGWFSIPLTGSSARFRIEAAGYVTADTGRIVLPKDGVEASQLFFLGHGVELTGHVVKRGLEKDPVAGATVMLCPKDERNQPIESDVLLTAHSDREGAFLLSNAPTGEYAVLARQESPLTTASKVVLANAQEAHDVGNIELGRQQFGKVLGKVMRLPKREGVEGLEILLRRMDGKRTLSSTYAKGEFSFDTVASGQFGVYVPEYHLYTWITLFEGEPDKQIEFFVGAGRLEGKVMRAGSPVSAKVKITQASQYCDQAKTTGADGSFLFEGLAPGAWTVQVAPAALSYLGRDFPVEILDGAPTQQTFNLAAGRLIGTVVDSQDQPVPDAVASVSFLPKGQASMRLEGRCDEHGAFSISDLDGGRYTVVATSSEKGIGKTADVEVPAEGNSAPYVVKLSSKGGTLISTALNMANGQPLRQAWCQFFPAEGGFWKHTQTRDASGVMTIPQIPPGKYKVQVSYFGFSISEHEVEIRDGETAKIDDVLYECGALTFSLQDGGGKAIADAAVRIAPMNSSSIEKERIEKTDDKGALTVRGLMPGRYRVTAEAPGHPVVSGEVGVQIRQIGALQLTAH